MLKLLKIIFLCQSVGSFIDGYKYLQDIFKMWTCSPHLRKFLQRKYIYVVCRAGLPILQFKIIKKNWKVCKWEFSLMEKRIIKKIVKLYIVFFIAWCLYVYSPPSVSDNQQRYWPRSLQDRMCPVFSYQLIASSRRLGYWFSGVEESSKHGTV